MNKHVLLLTAILALYATPLLASDADIDQIPANAIKIPTQPSASDDPHTIAGQMTRCYAQAKLQYPDKSIPHTFVQNYLRDVQGQPLNMPPNATSAAQLPAVTVTIIMDSAGKVKSTGLSDDTKKNYQQYINFRPSVYRAVMAVKICSPFKNIPDAQKNTEFTIYSFTLDPSPAQKSY